MKDLGGGVVGSGGAALGALIHLQTDEGWTARLKFVAQSVKQNEACV